MAAQPMNGAAAGMTGVGSSNGGASADGASLASKIHAALELVHNPYSAHASRAEASAFLEHVKTLEEAPFHGFSLASPAAGQPPVVRHYGLSLLEHAIRHRSTSPQQARALRDWVIELARDVDGRRDPGYLRAKIAQLWVEVAKRQWAADWMDMDELLVGLWEMPPRAADGATAAAGDAVQGAGGGPTVHKELVLAILETLSDDVFAGDDVVVAMREGVLSRACVEIFTPEQVLVEAFPQRKPAVSVRCGTEGWLERVSVLLDRCLRADVQGNEEVRSAALKALGVLYSLMSWAIPKAISASRCVVYMCNGLAAPNVAVQKVGQPFPHRKRGGGAFPLFPLFLILSFSYAISVSHDSSQSGADP